MFVSILLNGVHHFGIIISYWPPEKCGWAVAVLNV